MSADDPRLLTPMMRQYAQAKEEAGDALLLFRMGDFYELFFEDARTAAHVLGLTLTSRDKGENPVPMAGFPYHSLDLHLPKLLAANLRVALCDQVEDPKAATGLVKRAITRIITAGTLTDELLLDPRQSNFLAAVAPARTRAEQLVGVAWIDLSVGAITIAEATSAGVVDLLATIDPVECLYSDQQPPPTWPGRVPKRTARPAWTFTAANATDLLKRHYGVASFNGFGIEDDAVGLLAAGALLAYLLETQKSGLGHVTQLSLHHPGRHMALDLTTRRSLELTRTLREHRREGTLLDVLDQTVTAAGSRKLAEWLTQPLTDLEAIRHRQSAVGEWKEDFASRRELRDRLKETHDLERLISRISTGRSHPRDLAALRETLRMVPSIKARLAARNALFNAHIEERLELFAALRQRLEDALVDAPPIAVREGGIIRPGYHAGLDELREAAQGGKEWIAGYQRRESEASGIANLKVGYNKVFGYYLEVTHSHRDKAPPHWQRKQTVKNAERYITPELKEYEDKVLGAEDKAQSLEYDLFVELREHVANETAGLQRLAGALADLDVVLGFGEIASKRGYCRPMVVEGGELLIEAGRHPVLDATLPAGRFVPNDTRLDDDNGRMMLLTGPNMAGKSTYIRQNALLVLMAQIGSFLPAASATIGVVDRIFTRVGASDELGKGQSTFMVEMTETANILRNATAQSLVILDEIGRGTSTYDGVSLAWAIAEHLHDAVGCRTLFATHYHELIELEKTLGRLRNYNVAVREWRHEIIFLHQIVAGGADRSYGIHVARLAGVPPEVLERAQEILHQLEKDPFGEDSDRRARPKKHRRAYHQLSLFPVHLHPILEELKGMDPSQWVDGQASQVLERWRERLLEEESGK